MVSLFIRLEGVQNYGIYLYLKKPCFTVLRTSLVYVCGHISHEIEFTLML